MFVEDSVLEVVNPHVPFSPELLFAGGTFSIHQWLPGVPLVDLVLPGDPLPEKALSTLGALGGMLEGVPWGRVELLEAQRRFSGTSITDSAVFSAELTGWLSRVYRWCAPLIGPQLRGRGITSDPFASPVALSDRRRPLRLSHGDLNPHNCLWDGHDLRLIDWELALVADPAYDTASLLHRFSLHEDDEHYLLASALAEVPTTHRGAYAADVAAYRGQEENRSVVLGTLRDCLFKPPGHGGGAGGPVGAAG